jgi:hypothetical protein
MQKKRTDGDSLLKINASKFSKMTLIPMIEGILKPDK